MLIKQIRYENLRGDIVEEEFAFHMSKAETIEAAAEGELQKKLELAMSGSATVKQVMSVFREFVGGTVGQVSEDGKRFIRSPEITAAFMTSGAFDALLFEFMTDGSNAAEFVTNVFPKDLQQLAADVQAGTAPKVVTIPFPGLEGTGVEIKNDDKDPFDPASYSDKELLDMDQDFWDAIVGPVKKGMDKRLLGLAFKRRVRNKEVV